MMDISQHASSAVFACWLMKISLVEATPVVGAEQRSLRLLLNLPAVAHGHGAAAGRDRNRIFFIKKRFTQRAIQ